MKSSLPLPALLKFFGWKGEAKVRNEKWGQLAGVLLGKKDVLIFKLFALRGQHHVYSLYSTGIGANSDQSKIVIRVGYYFWSLVTNQTESSSKFTQLQLVINQGFLRKGIFSQILSAFFAPVWLQSINVRVNDSM